MVDDISGNQRSGGEFCTARRRSPTCKMAFTSTSTTLLTLLMALVLLLNAIGKTNGLSCYECPDPAAPERDVESNKKTSLPKQEALCHNALQKQKRACSNQHQHCSVLKSILHNGDVSIERSCGLPKTLMTLEKLGLQVDTSSQVGCRPVRLIGLEKNLTLCTCNWDFCNDQPPNNFKVQQPRMASSAYNNAAAAYSQALPTAMPHRSYFGLPIIMLIVSYVLTTPNGTNRAGTAVEHLHEIIRGSYSVANLAAAKAGASVGYQSNKNPQILFHRCSSAEVGA